MLLGGVHDICCTGTGLGKFVKFISSEARPRSVVITGVGAHSSLGQNAREIFGNLLSGKSGIGFLESFTMEEFGIQPPVAAAEMKFGKGVGMFDPDSRVPVEHVLKMSLLEKILYSCAMETVKDSGWIPPSKQGSNDDSLRCGIVVGSSFPNHDVIESTWRDIEKKGKATFNRYTLGHFVPSTLPCRTIADLKMNGPSSVVSVACASGVLTTVAAARSIQMGEADIMLAGGAELLQSAKFIFSSFMKWNQYCDATKFARPEESARPFDRDCTGVTLGDGAAFLLLEEREHAIRRGAHIYAEFSGSGHTNNARGMYAAAADMEGAAMSLALKSAGISPSQIDLISPHGTGTISGDDAECKAMKAVFGENITSGRIPVSATKSATGHIMSAAGTLEGVIVLLAMEQGYIPPTLNLHHRKPEGEGIDFVPLTAKRRNVRHAMNNAFGVGGMNVSAVFSKV